MKKLLFISVLLSFSSLLYSQQGTTNNRLIPLDDSKSLTLPEIQKSFNDYWAPYNVKDGYYFENGVKRKAPNWKIFKRWEYYWEQRVNQTTGEFPTTNSVIEYEKYLNTKNNLSKINYDESWVNLGTNSSTGGYAGIGRINCIAFHPTDVNTIWVGSPSGGIWKTTNLNLYPNHTWTILNDNELVLGVSDIVVDYTNPNILYIATGDRDGGSMWSLGGGQAADNVTVGVYKSTNGGSTWSATGLTFTESSGQMITRLLIDPTDNSILLASVNSSNSSLRGVYKTTNAGVNWVNKSGNKWIDMEFKPGDHNTIYGSLIGNYGSAYAVKSIDNGETWSYISFGTGGYRTELAVSPNASNVVYALVCNLSGGLLGVYKSINSGTSFTRVDDGTKSMLYYNCDGSGSNIGQGSYDLCIATSPIDANTVFIGGVNTWKSTDGGANWTINNMWTSNPCGAPEVHADKHALVFQNGTTLFEGNDGGVYKTTNSGTNWTDLTNGMVISQIYRIGVSQTSVNTVLTGLQDNGTKLFSGGTWTDPKGGDGMECIVDYSNSTYMYATYVRGQISRSTNNGISFPTNISALIPGGQPTGAWVTPYVIDQNNSATLFAGYDRVWKTTNRGNSGTWSTASQILSSSAKLRSLVIAPSNSNILYAADQTNMWKTTDGGATNWTTVTLPASSNSLTYIAVHNTDPNTVWITFGGYTAGAKVYESTDGGGIWTNISTGLPNLPVMSIVYYKVATDRIVLFVGTDVGVYVKDGTSNWAPFNTGLPNVVVSELEILYTGGTNKLRAGTFGRGLWETSIDAALPVELTSFSAKVLRNGGIKLDWRTETEVDNYGFEIERSQKSNLPDGKAGVKSQTSDEWVMIGFAEGHGNSNSPKDYTYADNNAQYGKYAYRLKQIDTDGDFEYSKVIEVDAGNIPEGFVLEQNYPNPFNPTTSIKFALAETQQAELKIFDVLGNEIATLFSGLADGGKVYEVEFGAANLSSGIYFYRLETERKVENRKMLLIK